MYPPIPFARFVLLGEVCRNRRSQGHYFRSEQRRDLNKWRPPSGWSEQETESKKWRHGPEEDDPFEAMHPAQ